MVIREEVAADQAAVRVVNERAFDRKGEADLVEGLRLNARPYISLVAEIDAQVVGHICFSPVEIESEAGLNALGLAPMAVLPEF